MGFDALAKRYSALVICLMLGVAAYFQASGLTKLVGALLAPASAMPPARPIGAAFLPLVGSDRDIHAKAILDRNPFDSSWVLHPPTADTPGHDVSPGADPYRDPPCDVIRAVIIASSEDPDWSFAALTGPDGKTVLRRRGEEFFGGKVDFIGSQHAIEPGDRDRRSWDRVWLTAPNGMRCQLELGYKPPARAGGPPPPPAGPNDGKIRRTGEHEFEVERSAVDALIANPAELMKVRVTPEKEGDRVVGLKLQGIKPGSLLGNLGIENGDRLTSINGFEMNDPAKMLEAYSKLLRADHLTANVVRNGKPMNLDFSIK